MLVANANEVSDPRAHDRARASARIRVASSSRSTTVPAGSCITESRSQGDGARSVIAP